MKKFGHLEYITAIGYILWLFGNLLAIWYILPRFGILCQEKSGNPYDGEPLWLIGSFPGRAWATFLMANTLYPGRIRSHDR
jgi:hypothetical protein